MKISPQDLQLLKNIFVNVGISGKMPLGNFFKFYFLHTGWDHIS